MYQPITNTRVTLKTAAELLDKDIRTIQSAFERKEIRGYKAAKKGVMLEKSSVLRYAEAKSIKLSPKAAADLKVTPSGRKLGVTRKAKKVAKAPRAKSTSHTSPAPKPGRSPRSRKPKIEADPLPPFENPVPAAAEPETVPA